MKNTIAQHVLRRIRAKRRAWVFTPKDFVDIGSRHAVDQSLHRLVEQEIIQRLDRGIYYYPESPRQKPLPTPAHLDAVARAIAAQTGDRAILTGEEAAYRLQLTGQGEDAPITQYDYLTTGRSKRRKIGHWEIRFRHSSFIPPESMPDAALNVMQALLFLGKEAITPTVIAQCAQSLTLSDRESLRKLASLSPVWLIPVLHSISNWPNDQEQSSPPKRDKNLSEMA